MDGRERHGGALGWLWALVFNRAGRLRSGWRFLFFAALFVCVLILLQLALVNLTAAFTDPRTLPYGWRYLSQSLSMLAAATVVGWLCNRLLEGLPPRALGWTLRGGGWLRDLGLGTLLGALSLALGAGLCAALGSYTFFFNSAAGASAIAGTLGASAAVFLLAAAMEEALFRGYPLQTFMRSWPAWLAFIPASVLFALVHLDNPNVARGFTFFNTLLAGLWLALAYWRTRTLWLPLGIHFGWNWAMGSLLGLPVSGISEISPDPVLRAADTGPTWLTGGHYGIEGGVACTVALLASSLFIWRTRLLRPDEELKRMTDGENPAGASGT